MTTVGHHPVASQHVKAGIFARLGALWRQHVQVTVPFHGCRDHLGEENTMTTGSLR